MKRVVALLLITAACGKQTIELPDVAGAKSVVLLLEGSSSAVEAHELDAPSRRISADGSEELTALFYNLPLVALGLSEGSVAPSTGSDARRLPPTPDVFRRSSRDDAWRDADAEESALFQSFRVAQPAPKICAAYGGCYPDQEDRACVVPCPEPAAPIPLASLDAVLPVLLPCPTGWGEIQRDAIAVCEPRSEESCGSGTYPFLGGACARITASCAPDGWPAPPNGSAVLWVRAGAAGIGTRNDPLGSIGAALAASAPASIIAVATGHYRESIALAGGRTLLGACAEELVLEGAVDVAEGSIAALTIEGSIEVSQRVELTGVGIIGSLALSPNAVLDGSRVVATATDRALIAGENTRVLLDDSVLAAPIAAALHAATATISRTFLRGTLHAIGGELRLFDSELQRAGGAALTASVSARIDGTGLVIRGEGEGASILGSPATITFTRTRIETGANAFNVDRGGSTTLEHVYLAQTGRTGDGAGVRSNAGVVVARRTLVVGSDAAFSVTNTNLLVTASTIRGGGRAVIAFDGAEVRVEASVIEETDKWAITIGGVVDRPGDTFQLVDLELSRIRGAMRIDRSQVGRFQRIKVIEATGPVFAGGLEGSSPLVIGEDLHVQGLLCDRTELDCGAIAVAQGSLELNRFALEHLDVPAVVINAGGAARLSNGRIVDAPVGVAAHGENRDARALLERVVFEDVASACDPCGD